MYPITVNESAMILGISRSAFHRLLVSRPELSQKIGGAIKVHLAGILQLVGAPLKLSLYDAYKAFVREIGSDIDDVQALDFFQGQVIRYVPESYDHMLWASHPGYLGGTEFVSELNLVPPGVIHLIAKNWREEKR